MAASFTFDGINKVIQLDTTSSFEVGTMYSRWKDWVLTTDNSKFLQAFRFVGGDPTVGGKSLGITYFLTNNWTIQPYSEDHRLQIEGNLFTDSGLSPIIPTSGSYNVVVEIEVSNINSAEAVPNATQEILEYQDVVVIDTLLGSSGSAYPIGLSTSPSNNITDTLTIASTYSLPTIRLNSNLTIGPGSNISNFHLEGKSKIIKVTLDNCPASGTSFNNIIITGNPL